MDISNLRKWYQFRGYLLGILSSREMIISYKSIRRCTYPDAIWINSLLKKYGKITEVILRSSADDAQLGAQLCFVYFYSYQKNLKDLEYSAKLKYPLAMAQLGYLNYDQNMVAEAAGMGEPVAMYYLGMMREAAKLGIRYAEAYLSTNLHGPEQYYWGAIYSAHNIFGCINGKNVYQIGKGIYDLATWKEKHNLPIEQAKAALSYYDLCNNETRVTVDCWLKCAHRMNIYNDLRRMIGVIIWNTRSEGLFKLDFAKFIVQ